MTLTKFNTLPVEERRVLIAKDVIKWLDSGLLRPRRGRYLTFSPASLATLCDNAGKFIAKHKCFVCARGALTAAWALGFGKDLVVFDIYNHVHLSEVSRIFPFRMQLEMEHAFESGMHSIRWVFNNIIQNKGTFIPTPPCKVKQTS